MATLKKRLLTKSAGGYNTLHLETSASIVKLTDGSNVQSAITSLRNSINNMGGITSHESEWITITTSDHQLMNITIPPEWASQQYLGVQLIAYSNNGYTYCIEYLPRIQRGNSSCLTPFNRTYVYWNWPDQFCWAHPDDYELASMNIEGSTCELCIYFVYYK